VKICHISDIHIRLKDRQEEYIEVFKELFKILGEIKPDRILLTGDIVHSKITMSPELIVVTRWFLRHLEKIAPIDLIAGNHDVNTSNKDRLDALSPIVETIDNTGNGINYYKATGLYQVGDSKFHYGVYSILDGKTINLKKSDKEDGHVYIALFHGPVVGCKLENGYIFEDASTSIRTFNEFDFVMLGDIHHRQFLRSNETAAFCGSLIQQDFGEELEKGFLLWDIKEDKSFTCNFMSVKNDCGLVTIHANEIESLPDKLPSKCKIRIIWEENVSRLEILRVSGLIRDKYNPQSIQLAYVPVAGKMKTIHIEGENLSDPNVQRSTLKRWFDGKLESDDIEKILELDKQITDGLSTNLEDFSNSTWDLKKMRIENFMSYGSPVEIDFENMVGIVGLFGLNASGKSVIIDAIMYALFNKTTRNIKNENLVNKYTSNPTCQVDLDITIGGDDYQITRSTTRKYKKTGEFINAKTDVDFKRKSSDGKWEDLKEDQRPKTEKIIRNAIGSFDDFVITSLSSQSKNNEFINQGPTMKSENMLRFLGLDIYSRKHDVAKDMLKTVDYEMKGLNLNGGLELVNTTRDDLKEKKTELSELKIRVNSISLDIEANQEKIGDNKSQINSSIKLNRSHEDIEKDKVKLEGEISSLDTTQKKLVEDARKLKGDAEKVEASLLSEDALRTLYEKKATHDKLKISGDDLVKNIESDKRLLNLYRGDLSKDDECPVAYDPKHSTCPYLAGHEQRKGDCLVLLSTVEKKVGQKKTIEDEISSLGYVVTEIDDNDKKLEEVQKFTSSLTKIKRDIENTIGLIESKQFSLKLVKNQLAVAEENRLALDKNVELKKQIEGYELQIKELKKSLNLVNTRIVDTERSVAIVEASLEKLERDLSIYEEKSRGAKLLGEYIRALHKDAIPAMLLRGHLSVINHEINVVLSSVVDFGVFLTMEDDSTDVEVVMKYDIDDTRPAQMGSGMEKLLINMAIRYALLSISSLNKPSVWIIDEGFGVLDSTNLYNVAKFFDNVRGAFKNIIIITHIDALKDVAQWVINVEKKGGVSYINDAVRNI